MQNSSNSIIEFRNVSKFYQTGNTRVNALSRVNLKMCKGDFVTVMGPSGGGKTTLLNMIGGLDRPDEGEIYLEGRLISQMNDGELTKLRREKIGFVFQFFNLLPTLTLRENVELPLLLNHAIKNEDSWLQKLFEYVGLIDRADSFPAELSGGEIQRIAMARALIHQPAIILADEPTGNLDSENGIKILDLMKKVCTDFKTTLVVVSHNPVITQYGNLHFEIRDGQIQKK